MSVITLNKSNFKTIVENHDFVIIDFWAEWCKPCVSFAETFKQAAAANPAITFGTLNTDDEPEIAEYFNVTQIPCVIAIKQQVIVDGVFGLIPAETFAKTIQKWRDYDVSTISAHFDDKKPAERMDSELIAST